MSDFTIEQLEALKEGTTPGQWDEDVIYPDCSSIVDDTGGRDVALAFAAPDLVDALIAEKQAHQETLHLVRGLWLDVHHHGYVGRTSVLRHLTRILEVDNG